MNINCLADYGGLVQRRDKPLRPHVCLITRLVGGTGNRPGAAYARPRLPSEIPPRPLEPARRPPAASSRTGFEVCADAVGPCPASLAIAVRTGWNVTHPARIAPPDGRFRWRRHGTGVTVAAPSCPNAATIPLPRRLRFSCRCSAPLSPGAGPLGGEREACVRNAIRRRG